MFLINWYGRPDFQFHLYDNVPAPDPDTGVDLSPYTFMQAWGGMSGPTWFFDVSAGPIFYDDSWNVDTADLDGDGILDYRIPPAWEYGNTSGYRPFTDLFGAADDDWRTGKPSFVYGFDTPSGRSINGGGGTAYTFLTIHESGHCLGLSHTFDGVDAASSEEFGPSGPTDVAKLGYEVDSFMSYLGGPTKFSTFDQHNLARWQVGRLLTLADADAATIARRPRDAKAGVLLAAADARFTVAAQDLRTANWIAAASAAAEGYGDVQRADALVGVQPAKAPEAQPVGASPSVSATRAPHDPAGLPDGPLVAPTAAPPGAVVSRAPAPPRHR